MLKVLQNAPRGAFCNNFDMLSLRSLFCLLLSGCLYRFDFIAWDFRGKTGGPLEYIRIRKMNLIKDTCGVRLLELLIGLRCR